MKTGKDNPKNWSPPDDAVSSNGVAIDEQEWAPPEDAVAVKKKDESVSPPSENGTTQPGLPDWATQSQPQTKPSGEPTLEQQIEAKREENIAQVKQGVPKIEAGLPQLPPITLGGNGKGIGEMGADKIAQSLSTQQDARDFLANQNKKLFESIAAVGKKPVTAQDVTNVKPLIKATESELTSNAQQFQDKEAARLREEAKTKEEADNGLSRFSSGAGTFDKAVVDTFTKILKSEAIAASETVGRLGLSGTFGKATDPTQDWAYQLADWVEKQVNEHVPENPKFQAEFWAKQFPEVAGSLLTYSLGGALGKTTRLADLTIPSASKAIMEQTAEHVPAAFMASASTAASEYERSLQETGDPDQAMRTWEKDMFTGLPFLVSPTFKAFNKATDGALKYGVKQFAQGGIAGGFQMGASHALQNLSAQQTYDKTREILDGVLATGGSGFAINGLLTGLLSAISHKAVGATGAEKAKYEQAIKDIQDQQAKVKDLGNTDYVVEGPESKFKGMAERPLNYPSGDLGLKMPEIISEAKNEIKSTGDTATIEQKAEEIIDNIKSKPTEEVVNDQENKPGVQGNERVGEEPVKAEPDQGASPQEAGGSGVVQEPPKEEVAPFKIGDQDTFYHATERAIQGGKLKPNNAPQFGTAVYLSTNKELVKEEFGDKIHEVKLAIENPVYTDTREWLAVEELALKKSNGDRAQKEGIDLNEEPNFGDYDISEIESHYISDAAKQLGYDAIIDKESSDYDNEIAVLDESKIIYPPTPEAKEGAEQTPTPNEEVVKEGQAQAPTPEGSKGGELPNQTDGRGPVIADLEGKAENADRLGEEEVQAGIDQANRVLGIELEQEVPIPVKEEPITPPTNETPAPAGSNALPSQQAPPNVQGVQEDVAPPGETPPPGEPPIVRGGPQPVEEPVGAGIKKALVPEEKVAEMADKLEQRTNEEFLEQGKKDVESGAIVPDEIINDVLEKHRALQTNEVAALVYHKAKMDNRFDAINLRLMKIKQEGGDPSEVKYLKTELDKLTQERDRFHEMQLITAREQGRAFGLRKMMLDNEYNLMSQVNQYKAMSADGEIPPEVMEHFKSIDEKLKKANERIAELERKSEEQQGKDVADSIKKQARKERAPGVKRGKALIDEGIDDLKKLFNQGSLGVVFDPKREAARLKEQDKQIIKSLAKIGRGMIDEGLATIEDVAKKLNEYIQDKFKGVQFANYEKEVVETINAGLPRPTVVDGRLKIPKSVIHDLVESGVDTIEELTTAIHGMVKKAYPDITERQVRDAITQYGKTVNLNQEEVAKKVRGMKRVGKLISQLEDVAKKLRPLRSGLQRDALSDKERTMQRELKDAMKDLPEDVGETQRVWKTAIEGVKSRLRNQITDLEEQIATGKKTPKKKGIVYDQEALKLQAERDVLRDQLQAIEGKPEISDEQRLRQAVTAAEKSLKDTERRVKEADFENTKKRTPVTSQELEEIRAKRDAAREQLDKIREELGVADKERLAKAKETVKKSQENYERRLNEGDFVREKKAPVTPDAKLEKAIIDRDKAKFEFDVAQEKNRLENRPWSEKWQDFAIDVFNIPKSLISSVDLSAILRQGLFQSVSHPGSVPGALKEMVRKMRSKEYEENWMHKLHQSDLYPMIKRSGLYMAEPHAKLSAREENFVSKLINKVPVIGSLVQGSNRAFTGYLNALRLDVFAKGVDQLKDAGLTEQNNPKAFKDWAAFINNGTGRGNLGAFERSAPILNTGLFSPRFQASRFNLLNLRYYWKMEPEARKMAIKDAMKFIGFGSAVMGMAAAAGADVEDDPRSSDFGKIRIGNTRYDIWGGFQPIVRTLAQLGSGQVKTSTGEIQDLGPGFGKNTRIDVIGKFFRGKEAPTLASLHNLAAGTNVVGEPVTPLGELERNVFPLYLQDMYQIYQAEGGKGVAKTMLPSLLGAGVQNYTSTGIDPEAPVRTISANHDYYISAPKRFSNIFNEPPTEQQYNEFIRIRGEEITRQFEENKDRLEKMSKEQYKHHMDKYVKRATEKARSKAGIPEKSKKEKPVEEEANF